jgi:CheY-like chemotaxis protein
VFLASNGQEALSILEKEHPEIAYLDVALPQVLGFEVCEIIKKSPRLKETKVVLVSSIYDKTRYKRAPSSLYGADDYIERHHINDGLIPKLRKMLNMGELSAPKAPDQPSASSVEIMDRESLSPRNGVREAEPSKNIQVSAPPLPLPVPVAEPAQPEAPPAVHQALVEQVLPEEAALVEEHSSLSALPLVEIATELEVSEAGTPPQEIVPALSPEETAKSDEAKRFARLIISDIALYNQKVIEEGIENGNVEELLKDEMAEAEKLFRERVSKEVREKTPYLQDALRDLVDRKRKMMKQGN